MPKLSKEEKLKLVRRYIGGHYVPTPEGYRSRTAFKASLLAWAKRYRMYGEKGLERKAKTAAGALDKAEAVRRCLSGNGLELVPCLFTIRDGHGKVHR